MTKMITSSVNRLFFRGAGPAAVFCLLWGACVQSPAGDPSGQLVRRTDCKGSQALTGGGAKSVASSSRECIEYSYDGRGVLLLKHVNAAFNCCPGTIAADIQISAASVRIKESESSALCCCDCLYDLDYECVEIKPGVYKITVLGPYQPAGDPPLEFLADLRTAVSGTFCVDRTQYPWGY